MITPKQLAERKTHLGASDISAIYGVNPFKGATELWMEKVYPMKDLEPSEAMNTGNDLEPIIVSWIAGKLKLEVDTNPEKLYYVYEKDSLFAANLDALVLNYPTAVEAKYSGNESDWSESDNQSEGDIPALYYIQCQAQMMCAGFDYIILALWLSSFHGFEKRYYIVQRDNERIEKLELVGRKWWNRYVIPAREAEYPEKFMPPSKQPLRNLDVFSRIDRVPGKINKVDSKTYLAWTDAKKELSKAKKVKNVAEEAFKKEFGDARSAEIIGGGGQIFTFKDERGSRRLDYDVLKLKHPEIYKEMVTRGERQTLREIKIK